MLADERIEVYECGRDDIRSGQIDRRVLAMADHADHIHVGFAPRAEGVFGPGAWDDLLDRLGEIENPAIPADSHNLSAPFP